MPITETIPLGMLKINFSVLKFLGLSEQELIEIRAAPNPMWLGQELGERLLERKSRSKVGNY